MTAPQAIEAARAIVEAHAAVERAKKETHPSFKDAVLGIARHQLYSTTADCALAVARALLALSEERDAMAEALRPFAKIVPSTLYSDADNEDYVAILHELPMASSEAPEFTRQDILKARAALSGTSPREGWRPIETAPKDGTLLLLGSDRWGPPRTGHAFAHVSGWYCPYTGDALEPTYWQPLSSPPKDKP